MAAQIHRVGGPHQRRQQILENLSYAWRELRKFEPRWLRDPWATSGVSRGAQQEVPGAVRLRDERLSAHQHLGTHSLGFVMFIGSASVLTYESAMCFVGLWTLVRMLRRVLMTVMVMPIVVMRVVMLMRMVTVMN
eukprot:3526570-Pyramimonas_sp.AAC.1